ncbi:MAG: response regulator [Deltaproteobacteria bacterium]|nr:response regulator [Deltaproteobacteria bacterium]
MNQNNKVVGIMSISAQVEKTTEDIKGISQTKNLQEDLQKALRAVDDANRSKADFLANMTHELRTPMNGIIGMTGLLFDTPLNEEQKDYLSTIQKCADSLMSIVNDILDFSKIESGRMEIENFDFNLSTALDEMIQVPAAKAQEKGLEFIYQVEPDIPSFLQGDPGRLRQVIMNLSDNAVRFTEKGEVVIRVKLEDASDTHVKVRFVIMDTGIGIPNIERDRLFNAFHQVDSSVTRRYGGTGLGLAISKQLVEQMGGEIGVESKLDEGSIFWFTIPFKKQVNAPREAFLQPDNMIGKRILLIDDNKTSLEVLQRCCESWGCVVDLAQGGEMAFSLMRAVHKVGAPYDLVIMDLQMPEMDGAEIGRIIKTDPDLKDTVMIILSPSGMRGDASRMKQIGFAGYLTKPIRSSQLYDCAVAVLGLKTDDFHSPVSGIVTRHEINEKKKRRGRILLVEDNKVNQKLATRLLEKFGYRSDIAVNGKRAVKALETAHYDLVLMDIQMPEMDGIEATKIIRDPKSKVKNHEIPIIAMTAYVMTEDREKCLQAGMNDYLTKPINPQELEEVIEEYLFLADLGDVKQASAEVPGENAFEDGQSIQGDFNRTELLGRVNGDEELCNELLELFVDDFPVQMATLKRAMERKDMDLVSKQAHTIKGAAANIGATALREAAFRIETAGKGQDPGRVRIATEMLDKEFEKFETIFSKVKIT